MSALASKRLDLIDRIAGVQRFHLHRLIAPQNVAEHSANVALICHYLSDDKPSMELLMAALLHDAGETLIGDIPAPTKWKLTTEARDELDQMEAPVLERAILYDYPACITPRERRTLKFADTAECAAKCLSEMRLGNWTLEHVYEGCAKYLNDTKPEPGSREQAVIDALGAEYEALLTKE